jgi:hypothetical protein
VAGIVVVLAGATLVFIPFPRRAEERSLLAAFHAQDADTADRAPVTGASPRAAAS